MLSFWREGAGVVRDDGNVDDAGDENDDASDSERMARDNDE